jgi:hypothetical protein
MDAATPFLDYSFPLWKLLVVLICVMCVWLVVAFRRFK